MAKVNAGGRNYRKNPKPFKAHDSNTICDVTGFRVKMSNVLRRWEGFYVIRPAWNPRQPQDFPVVPTKQRIFKDSRKDDADELVDVTIIDSGDFV
jgi:hypothetical protein